MARCASLAALYFLEKAVLAARQIIAIDASAAI
jgi:hypothetical protein